METTHFKKATIEGLEFNDGRTIAVIDHDPALPIGAVFLGFDSETLTLTYAVPAENGGEPAEQTLAITEVMITNAVAKVNAPAEPIAVPLRERLKSVTGAFPAVLKAAFPFERVAYWLDQGDEDAAKAVIEGVDVSSFPQDVQEAHAALLAQFD